ncbi:hypothetical protein D8788_03930 [Streptococcus mitis]|uniref:Uncharacterized protein n=1 Tax=Streptococcus mitis TaxID=28037 RepID=A0A428HBS6_STRMT|nr:hypothetical protein D8788_03930 [Streptococcus mitis]
MTRLKSFITRYFKVYIGLVLLIWLAFFLSSLFLGVVRFWG